ncbi:MAG: hypothetical protein M1150_01380 [Patescibacteria group bacterium]|nr:hypothetical protein [Patescibacteria group bacterium]
MNSETALPLGDPNRPKQVAAALGGNFYNEGTEYCRLWLASHRGDCQECRSYLGCLKARQLDLIMTELIRAHLDLMDTLNTLNEYRQACFGCSLWECPRNLNDALTFDQQVELAIGKSAESERELVSQWLRVTAASSVRQLEQVIGERIEHEEICSRKEV